jgi:hypothetical protein
MPHVIIFTFLLMLALLATCVLGAAAGGPPA